MKSLALSSLCIAALLASAGCVRRQLTVTSNPTGALVYLNDREVGRTPFTTDFVWYGTYDVMVRKEGYETLHKKSHVLAPWWGYPPIDLFAEMVPWHLTDHHKLSYVMRESSDVTSTDLIARALELKSQLPATRPTTGPAVATR